ncbi:MAG: hypothetical protein ACRCZ0_08395 [Cetobacterium sp.]
METLSETNRQLPTTGTIKMSQVNTELNKTETSMISLNDDSVRALAGKLSGEISLRNLHGKYSSSQGSTGIKSVVNEQPWYGSYGNWEYFSQVGLCSVQQGYPNVKIAINSNIKLLHTIRDGEAKVPTVNCLCEGAFVDTNWQEITTQAGGWGMELTGATPARPVWSNMNNDWHIELKTTDLNSTWKTFYSQTRVQAGFESIVQLRAYLQNNTCYAQIRVFVPARLENTMFRFSMSYDIGITSSI